MEWVYGYTSGSVSLQKNPRAAKGKPHEGVYITLKDKYVYGDTLAVGATTHITGTSMVIQGLYRTPICGDIGLIRPTPAGRHS